MTFMLLFFGIGLFIALCIAFWINTKKGKKWLEGL